VITLFTNSGEEGEGKDQFREEGKMRLEGLKITQVWGTIINFLKSRGGATR